MDALAIGVAVVLALAAAALGPDAVDVERRARLRERMREAGLEGRWALEGFAAIRALLALALPLAVVPTLVGVDSLGAAFGAVVVTAALGYCAPSAWLRLRLRRAR